MLEAQPKMLLTFWLSAWSGAAIEVGVRLRKKLRLPQRLLDPLEAGDGERAGVQGRDNLPSWTIVADEDGRDVSVAAAAPFMADDGLLAGI